MPLKRTPPPVRRSARIGTTASAPVTSMDMASSQDVATTQMSTPVDNKSTDASLAILKEDQACGAIASSVNAIFNLNAADMSSNSASTLCSVNANVQNAAAADLQSSTAASTLSFANDNVLNAAAAEIQSSSAAKTIIVADVNASSSAAAALLSADVNVKPANAAAMQRQAVNIVANADVQLLQAQIQQVAASVANLSHVVNRQMQQMSAFYAECNQRESVPVQIAASHVHSAPAITTNIDNSSKQNLAASSNRPVEYSEATRPAVTYASPPAELFNGTSTSSYVVRPAATNAVASVDILPGYPVATHVVPPAAISPSFSAAVQTQPAAIANSVPSAAILQNHSAAAHMQTSAASNATFSAAILPNCSAALHTQQSAATISNCTVLQQLPAMPHVVYANSNQRPTPSFVTNAASINESAASDVFAASFNAGFANNNTSNVFNAIPQHFSDVTRSNAIPEPPCSSNRFQPQPSHATPSNSIDNAIQSLRSASFANTVAPRKLLDLPEFSGRAEEWPIFFRAYIESSAAYCYSNFENCQRLNKCLKGSAREVVKSLLIQPDNVSQVVEQLQISFGRPEQLIRSQMKIVREISAISESSMSKIVPFATKTRNLVAFLMSANGNLHLSNPMLLEELVCKLPLSKRVEWTRYAESLSTYPTIANFSTWLSEAARIISIVQDADTKEAKPRPVLHAVNNTVASKADKPVVCPCCRGSHSIVNCERFLKVDVETRWKDVKRWRLCFCCLRGGHSLHNCRSRRNCQTDGCTKPHHKLLHEKRDAVKSSAEAALSQDAVAVLNCSSVIRNSAKLLFRVLPVTLHGPNKRVDTFALFDEGSSVTMLDKSLISDLGLRANNKSIDMQWFGGKSVQQNAAVVNLRISGRNMKQIFSMKEVYGVDNLKLPVQTLTKDELPLAEQNKLPFDVYEDAVPKILIGLDHCHLGFPYDNRRLSPNGPFAAKTSLGWVVYGRTSYAQHPPSNHSCLFAYAAPDDMDLHAAVADYFEIESLGVKAAPPLVSAEDMRANAILAATTVKLQNQYQVGLLWKKDNIVLPESFQMAIQRLIGIERKMMKSPEFADAYKSIIQSYIAKNYCRKLSAAEAECGGPRVWYLPHFAAYNPNKPSKIRLVFDAAASSKGVSLNSQLLKGPQDYRPLTSILFHFREGAIAVCADIKEMFHQVVVQPADRSSQRFLWRDGDGTKPPDIYEMVAMTFGAACSPCTAHHIKIKNALQHSQQNPRAVKAIVDYHYVDDFVDSFQSEAEAIDISKQVRQIHKDAAFDLRNFVSNSPAVTKALDGVEHNLHHHDKTSLCAEKVLGMVWQPASDEFMYVLKFHYVSRDVLQGERKPSKRELLSIIEAENVVNSRPLTHLPLSSQEEEPLTPNHFLLGSSNTANTHSVEQPAQKWCSIRKQWLIARQLRDAFWKKWIDEYLPTLTRRVKWCTPSKPIQPGGLVLVIESNVPRRQWKPGVVVQVHHGKDGHARRAEVAVDGGTMRRPVSKLAIIDVVVSEGEVALHGGGDVE